MRTLILTAFLAGLLLVAALALVRVEPAAVHGPVWLPGKPGRPERWWVVVRLPEGTYRELDAGRRYRPGETVRVWGWGGWLWVEGLR